MDAHDSEFVLFVKNRAGKYPFCFQDKVYFTVWGEKKEKAIEVFWQIFVMGLFQTVKYVQHEIFQLPFP